MYNLWFINKYFCLIIKIIVYQQNTKHYHLTVAKDYNSLLSTDARLAISPNDGEISKRCEQVLLSSSCPCYTPLLGSVGSFYAMKSTLSYYDAAAAAAATKSTKSTGGGKDSRVKSQHASLKLHEFLLVAPLLHVRQFSRFLPSFYPAVIAILYG